jgi:putative tricarboxylic transport membrane protein
MELAIATGNIFLDGWPLVANPLTLMLILASVLVGMAVGAIPGLTANMSVAVLVPLTFTLEPSTAISVLAGIWLGALYGGTIPAVLINMPGTPADMMTTIDGYPMSRRGEAGRAIGIGVISSFTAGTFSVVVLGVAGPALASVATSFGSGEYFAIAVLGLSVIAFVSGTSMTKGLGSALAGLLVGVVGRDVISGIPRLTFGEPELFGGLQFIAVVVGIFGLSEVVEQVYKRQHGIAAKPQRIRNVLSAFQDVWPLRWVLARSSIIGTLVGIVPGAGPTIASIISYGTQKQLSKHPELMGKGAPEGVSASDGANNAASGGGMLTMLSLGIPGDALTAILLGALVVQGVQPGPLLFANEPRLVSAIFINMLLANVALLAIGLFGARHFARVLDVPRPLLYPAIALACIIGTYAVRGSTFDVGVMLGFAALGFLFSRLEIPKAPLVLGVILGPILEENLRRMLQLHRGDVGAVVHSLATSAIAAPILAITLMFFLMPSVRLLRARRKVKADTLEVGSEMRR